MPSDAVACALGQAKGVESLDYGPPRSSIVRSDDALGEHHCLEQRVAGQPVAPCTPVQAISPQA